MADPAPTCTLTHALGGGPTCLDLAFAFFLTPNHMVYLMEVLELRRDWQLRTRFCQMHGAHLDVFGPRRDNDNLPLLLYHITCNKKPCFPTPNIPIGIPVGIAFGVPRGTFVVRLCSLFIRCFLHWDHWFCNEKFSLRHTVECARKIYQLENDASVRRQAPLEFSGTRSLSRYGTII